MNVPIVYQTVICPEVLSSVVKWDMQGAFVENSAIVVGVRFMVILQGGLLLSHRVLSWVLC